jgi:hypothetical protein
LLCSDAGGGGKYLEGSGKIQDFHLLEYEYTHSILSALLHDPLRFLIASTH